jgi:hypothetical protein
MTIRCILSHIYKHHATFSNSNSLASGADTSLLLLRHLNSRTPLSLARLTSGHADPKPLPSLLPTSCTTLETWLRRHGGLAQGIAAAVVARWPSARHSCKMWLLLRPLSLSPAWLYDSGDACLLLETGRNELLDSS